MTFAASVRRLTAIAAACALGAHAGPQCDADGTCGADEAGMMQVRTKPQHLQLESKIDPLERQITKYWDGLAAKRAHGFNSRSPAAKRGQSECGYPECRKPNKAYEAIIGLKPGVQWMDHGGYCGSWSIQHGALAKGAWISQQQVRDHSSPGGGNDNEILETNIDDALDKLKLKAEGFDYKNLPTPQAKTYLKWIKSKLAAGHAVVWMIMMSFQAGQYPLYPSLPYGIYGHIEPVVGVMSDHPLNDTEYYDDDVLLHFTDADDQTYYRSMASLPDDQWMNKTCTKAIAYPGAPCVYEKWGFGWAIEGVQDERPGVPVLLSVEPAESEPNTRLGEPPIMLRGTLAISNLTEGERYAIYRWDSVADAFNYSRARLVRNFTAAGPSESYEDPVHIASSSATYFRCVPL